MSRRVSVAVVIALSFATRLNAQEPVNRALLPAPATVATAGGPADTVASRDRGILLPPGPSPKPGGFTFGAPTPRNPFASIGHDLTTFFTSRDTAVVLGVFAPAAAVAATWDEAGIDKSQQYLKGSHYKAGNIGGGFFVQAGVAAGTWAIGAMTDSPRTQAIGGDLLRAQITSQIVVQGVKFVTQRERPDGSNSHSFPSGHTASAFATATVLNRHLGWKVGLPAYSYAAFVGISRMAANKHHMSDVIMGAAVGLAAGRAVTVGVGGAKFDLGVSPTQGGAAVTFTKK
jgi:membrane-associated phospholipid phosphatase